MVGAQQVQDDTLANTIFITTAINAVYPNNSNFRLVIEKKVYDLWKDPMMIMKTTNI